MMLDSVKLAEPTTIGAPAAADPEGAAEPWPSGSPPPPQAASSRRCDDETGGGEDSGDHHGRFRIGFDGVPGIGYVGSRGRTRALVLLRGRARRAASQATRPRSRSSTMASRAIRKAPANI